MKSTSPNYPSAHLHSLPYEILLEIFNYFEDDIKTLLNLALACLKFQIIVNKNYLYKNVRFVNSNRFYKFSLYHLPLFTNSLAKRFGLNESSNKINFMSTVQFINPPSKELDNHKTNIAGSYNVESTNRRDTLSNYSDYMNSFTSLLKESFGLKTIVISEISPSFNFPNENINESSHSHAFWKRESPRRTINKVILKTQTGWSLPFKLSHISSILDVYDTINELVLCNFIIDDYKLTTNTRLSKKIIINKLTLNSCIYSNTLRKLNQKKKVSDLFQATNTLQLSNILSGNDLSTIDFIKINNHLSKLIIDFDSTIFYTSSDNNERVFKFERYNLFFKLLCSGQGAFVNIKELVLINFDLFASYCHKQNTPGTNDAEHDDWVRSSTNTFETLLSYLSPIANLSIVLKERPKKVHRCLNCGSTKNEDDTQLHLPNSKEWSVLLHPLLANNEDCTVKIFDFKGNTAYIRSKNT